MRLTDFAAVLFDMDGTLIDTEPLWHEAEISLLADFGVPWSVEQAAQHTGLNMPAFAALMQDLGVTMPAGEIIEVVAQRVLAKMRSRLGLHDDVVEVLLATREQQVATALVTMSPLVVAREALAKLPPDAFDVVLTAEDVANGKPHPEPYLIAADRLGVAAEDCLVIEDSRVGIASGLAAGCTVLSVGPLAGSIDGAPALADTRVV